MRNKGNFSGHGDEQMFATVAVLKETPDLTKNVVLKDDIVA